MKHLFCILIIASLLSACPPLPNHIRIYFNKKGVSLDIKKLQDLAKKENLQSNFIKDKNISIVILKKGDFAYSEEGKAILISPQKVKNLIQKAYEQKILHINKKDLQELKKNIFPEADIFFLPKECKLNRDGQLQVAYKSKIGNIKAGHWYAVENNSKIVFKNRCPEIRVYR